MSPPTTVLFVPHARQSDMLVAVQSRSLVSACRRKVTSDARHIISDGYDVLIGSERFNENRAHLCWVRKAQHSEQVRYFALWREYHAQHSATASGATHGVDPETDGAEEQRQGVLAWRAHCERVLDRSVSKHWRSHDPPGRDRKLLKTHGSALQNGRWRNTAEGDRNANVSKPRDAGVILVDDVRDLALFGAKQVRIRGGSIAQRTACRKAQRRVDADRVGPRRELLDRRCHTAREQRHSSENSDFHFGPLISIRTVSEVESNAREPYRKVLS